jgi:hypothetical protein
MSVSVSWLRLTLLSAVIVVAAACSSSNVLPSQNPALASVPPIVASEQHAAGVCGALAGMPALATVCRPSIAHAGLVPMATYTYQFKNGTDINISWHRIGENCMNENVPNVNDVKPGETVQFTIDTNGGCCRCSHETSWFVLKYTAPSGDYRDVGFDKAVGKSWVMSNRGSKGDLYYCQRLGGPSIDGLVIKGNHCP